MNTDDVKDAIREKYGDLARSGSSCCGPSCGCGTDDSAVSSILMNDDYTSAHEAIVAATDMGLGCGTPTAFAELTEGMTVLDLGSGAGIDVFLAAKAVGPAGSAIGVDMTDDMIARANANKAKLGITNAEFRKGEIEHLPVESNSVDRIISNCVINLVPDKNHAFAEMFRVLKPGGSFTVSDIVSVGQIPDDVRKDLLLWAGCVAGALDKEDYLQTVRNAGFRDLHIVTEKPYHLDQSVSFGLESITLTARK